MTAQPRHLRSLTGLRFYAALAVLLRHTVEPFLPVPVLRELAIPGPIGVGLFFVLSGFVLTWSWRPEASTGRFWFNRFARIYPLHLLLTVVAFALLWTQGTPRWASTVLSLFLVQSWLVDRYREGGNGVSWSLSCEAFFYACFPFLIRPMSRWPVRRALTVVPVVMALMVTYTAAYAVVEQRGLWWSSAVSTYTNPAYRIGEFVIGICLAVAVKKGFRLRIPARTALAAGAVGYVTVAVLNWGVVRSGVSLGGEAGLPLGVLDLLFLPLTVLLITALASADVDDVPTPISGPRHIKLGEWSFALYLVQIVVIESLERILGGVPSRPVGALCLVGSIAVCIALSALLYERFERPLNLRLRSWRNARALSSISAP